MKIIQNIIYWLFVCCLPVLLITSTICLEVNELSLYEYGFDKYEISQDTGIDKIQLRSVAQHLIDYFNLRADTVQITVVKGDEEFNLFNEREVIHLGDVRSLIQLDYWVQRGAFLLIVICALALFFGLRVGWWMLVRGLFWGSFITMGLMVALALWALFGFERLFILFHLVSFTNEYWILDPARDYLIRLFPGGFFYDAALFGFGAIMLEALLIGGIAFGILRLRGWERREKN
ncbi:MAG: TIGR01906 family membrane protein [Dehalococcoidia bacterium]|nr:TIGR01906 family membrane protein [Dehalococcoidia bacterium]